MAHEGQIAISVALRLPSVFYNVLLRAASADVYLMKLPLLFGGSDEVDVFTMKSLLSRNRLHSTRIIGL